jgi:hypothetical protein
MADSLLQIACHGASLDAGIVEARLFSSIASRLELTLGAPAAATATMTSDTTPTPNVISASSFYNSTYAPWNAFDKDSTRYWQANDPLPNWLKYFFGSGNGIVATKYSIKAPTNSEYIYTPKSWTVEGSNNDQDWFPLDNQENITFTQGEEKEFTFSNSVKYEYFRLNVSESAYTSVNQLEIYKSLYPANSPIATLQKVGGGDAGQKWTWNGDGLLIPENLDISGSPLVPNYQYGLFDQDDESDLTWNGVWLPQAGLQSSIGTTQQKRWLILRTKLPSSDGTVSCAIDDGYIPATPDAVAGGKYDNFAKYGHRRIAG